MADETDKLNKLIQLKDAQQNLLFPKVVLKSIYANTTATTPFDFDSLATDAELKVVRDDLTTLQGEVAALTSAAITRQVVTALPTEGQKENVIYMILKTDDSDAVPNTGSVYNEYMWINGGWQLIGDTALDLSGYVTDGELDTYKGEVTAALALKADSSVVEGINGRLGTAEGEIDALQSAVAGKADSSVVEGIDDRLEAAEGEIDVLQAATAGYDGTNTISAAIGLKADASVVEGIDDRVEAVEGEVDALQAVTSGYTGEGAIKTAVDAKAESSVVEGIDDRLEAAEGEIDALQALNATTVYYEDLGEIVEA